MQPMLVAHLSQLILGSLKETTAQKNNDVAPCIQTIDIVPSQSAGHLLHELVHNSLAKSKKPNGFSRS